MWGLSKPFVHGYNDATREAQTMKPGFTTVTIINFKENSTLLKAVQFVFGLFGDRSKSGFKSECLNKVCGEERQV